MRRIRNSATKASPMILICGTIRLPPDRLTEAREPMRVMVQASRAEEGCLEYAYAEDVLTPGLIRVFERWTGRDALDAHFASAHIHKWRASWPTLGIADRQLTLYEVSCANAA